MKKSDIIEILYHSAMLFDKHLRNKNLLIVYGQPNVPQFIETRATNDNFIHLTGINITDKKITAAKFYENILDRKVSEEDFELKKDGTSELKLKVLPYIMEINKYSKIMGVYNNKRPKLRTDKLVGNITASLGFILTGKYYVPNTVLNGDIRDDIEKSQRVLAILSKEVKEQNYSQIETIAKKINISDILVKISDKISIAAELINEDTISEKSNEEKPKECSDKSSDEPLPQNTPLFCLADLKSEKYAPSSQKDKTKENNKSNDIEI